MTIAKHLGLLGFKVEDVVTGTTGVVTSIAFDLYGCIQAVVSPGLDKEGKPRPPMWFDIARLKITSESPVMTPPNFETALLPVVGNKGPAEKP